jgi:methylated-DNA-protein-cysteine methyltransferase related protein
LPGLILADNYDLLKSPVMKEEKKSSFFDDVYEVVKLIPKGRVTSYGAIAAYLGTKMSARMVGWAMNAAHVNKKVPAHRVVNRHGLLTGRLHFETPATMQQRLEKEGVNVKNNQVRDFDKRFWDPAKELG